MSKSSHLFEGLVHHSGKSFGRILDTKEKDSPPVTVIIGFVLALAAIFTFVGNTAVKVFFRKTPVLSGFDLVLTILAFGAFGTVGVCSILEMHHSEWLGSPASFLITGVLYLALSLFILIKGIKYKIRKPFNEEESILTTLAKENWNQRKIKTLGEPMLVMLIGIFYSFFNLLGGLPLIFCAVSVWLHLLKDAIIGNNSLPEQVQSMNMKIVAEEGFHSVQPNS